MYLKKAQQEEWKWSWTVLETEGKISGNSNMLICERVRRLEKNRDPSSAEDKKEQKWLASTESEEFRLSLVLYAKVPSFPGECKRNLSIFLLLSLKELKVCKNISVPSQCYCRTQLCNHCCAFCFRNALRWKYKQKVYCHCANIREMLGFVLRLLLEHVVRHQW